MSDAEQEYGTWQVPDEERHDEEEPEECGVVWGWHDEHRCEELDRHPFPLHFCECGAEKDYAEAAEVVRE